MSRVRARVDSGRGVGGVVRERGKRVDRADASHPGDDPADVDSAGESVPAVDAGLGRRFQVTFTGVRSGPVETPLVMMGALAVTAAVPTLPCATDFVASAMLFVTGDEVVSETHFRGNERVATLARIVGHHDRRGRPEPTLSTGR